MKNPHYFILPLFAVGAVSLSSCNKKEQPAAPKEAAAVEAPAPVVETPQEQKPVAPDALEVLAKQAGFAKFLPKETDVLWTLYDGAGLAKKLHGSKVGQFVVSLMEEDGTSLDEMLEDPGFQKFAEITGEELFFALGDDSAEQLDRLLQVSASSNYYQMRSMVKLCAQSLEEEESMESFDESQYLIEWLKDPQTMAALKEGEMPSMYMGFKVSDEAKRQEYLSSIQGFTGMMLSMQGEDSKVAVAAEKDAFSGVVFRGELIAKNVMEKESEQMVETFGEEGFEQLKEAVSKQDVVFLVGEHEGYVVFFFGASTDALKLAATPSESVLAHPGMQFAQQYAGKELVSLNYLSDDVMQSMLKHNTSFKDLARGVLAGLNETDVFGDTQILETLLKDLMQREKDYYAPYSAGRYGAVSMLEDGFKLESYYGGNSPAVDLQAKRQLHKVADMDGVIFSANWVSNPEQTARGFEYLDAVGSTAYQIAKQLSGLHVEDSDFQEFTSGLTMFDAMFKDDALQVWSALRGDLSEGMGAEGALVVDINGELPTVPEVPEEIVKNAKVPRVSYVSTVDDRSKISASWDKIEGSAESLLKKFGSMSGKQIPMQRPFKSESNGLMSWTFPIPCTHQNCVPNVSLNDQLFILGTSSEQSAAIAKAYEAEATGEALSEVQFNFGPLRELGAQWLELVEKHGEGFMSESDFSEFKEMQPQLKGLIEASEEVDYLRVESKQEGSDIHSALHLKTH